ncbi:MAG TPA: Chromate resistance protein ChrB [Thermomicrobiales bacterium]|nr:Chromate resistance protein ChrB [Thermomicrobiales bacterium]
MAVSDWLLFLPHLPSSPSSLRVLVWRRMRAAGAVGLQNGVWILPADPDQERFLRDLVAEIAPQGGNGQIFRATPLQAGAPEDIVERFRADRDEDYVEFRGRCADFLAELARETERRNFTFAELEENEQDLQKLVGWLRKIRARDFFEGRQAAPSEEDLARCQGAFEEFTRAVYARAGLAPPDEDAGA